ncbi:MAG: hypothetical protein ACRD0Q_05880 [Acidimicrobiales bacterium]
MTGVHTVLGALAGVGIAVAITIRVWLVNRFAGTHAAVDGSLRLALRSRAPFEPPDRTP